MKAKFYYDSFSSEEKHIIEKISVDLANEIGLELEIIRPKEAEKTCKIKMFDKIGVAEVQSSMNKEDIRDFITVLKQAYLQLTNK